ncbi:MAG: hypothetical protein ACOX8N_03025 [Christensenellales bacterium]
MGSIRARPARKIIDTLERLQLTIGGDTHDIRPCDSWLVPGNVAHGEQNWRIHQLWGVLAVKKDYQPSVFRS